MSRDPHVLPRRWHNSITKTPAPPHFLRLQPHHHRHHSRPLRSALHRCKRQPLARVFLFTATMVAEKKTKKTHESVNNRQIHRRLQNCAQHSQEFQREADNYVKQLPAFAEIRDRVLCHAFQGIAVVLLYQACISITAYWPDRLAELCSVDTSGDSDIIKTLPGDQ